MKIFLQIVEDALSLGVILTVIVLWTGGLDQLLGL